MNTHDRIIEQRYNKDDYQRERGIDSHRFAQDILFNENVVTMMETDRMYYSDDTVYQPYGESYVEHIIETVLGSAVSNHYVNEVKESVRRQHRRYRDDFFDLPPHKIAVENGLLNLKTGELEDIDEPPRTRSKLPVEWNPDADTTKICEFVTDITGNSDDYYTIFELIGHCLYRGWIDQKSVMLLGEGANGKSTLLNLITQLLGTDNVSAVSLQDFDRDRFATASLDGKLANIHADISDDGLKKTGRFKLITGEDRIRAQRKHEQPFEFKNTAKPIFSANTLPKTHDNTDAFFRRWIIIEFPYQFKGEDQDEDLIDKLTTPENLSGLLCAAVDGFQRLQERGGFKQTETMQEIQEKWERQANSAKAFVEDHLVQSASSYVTRKQVRSRYADYCDERGLFEENPGELYKVIRSEFNVAEDRRTVNGERQRRFIHVKFRSDGEGGDDVVAEADGAGEGGSGDITKYNDDI